MDLKLAKFGEGTREVGGGVDLINHYNLRPIHELFCKRSLRSSTLESHYLQNVVGEIVIRKGEGMELDQLLQKTFSAAEKGRPTSSLKLISDSKDKKKVQIREDEHNKCSKLNRRGDGIRNEHLEFGSVHLKMLKDKKAEKKPAPEPAPAPPEPLKPTPHSEGSRHRFSGFMDPYMDAWGGGGRYFTDMTDYLSSNRRLNQIELTNTRRITFHFNEFDGSYYDAPPIPWSNRHHHDDDYHCYGRNPFAPPRTFNYMLPPPPMQSPSRYYGGGYELPYYSMPPPPPPPPGRYPSYFY